MACFHFLSTNDSFSCVLLPSCLFELTANAQLPARKLSGIALLFLGLSRWAKYSFWHTEPCRQGWEGKRVLGKQPGRRRVDSSSTVPGRHAVPGSVVCREGDSHHHSTASTERCTNLPAPPLRMELGAHHMHPHPGNQCPERGKPGCQVGRGGTAEHRRDRMGKLLPCNQGIFFLLFENF